MQVNSTPLPPPPLTPTPMAMFIAMKLPARTHADGTQTKELWFVARAQTGRSVCCVPEGRARAEAVAREMNLAAMRAQVLR